MICIKKVIYIYKSHEDSLMHKRIKNNIIETKNYINNNYRNNSLLEYILNLP